MITAEAHCVKSLAFRKGWARGRLAIANGSQAKQDIQ
jgi:hypothetical protein